MLGLYDDTLLSRVEFKTLRETLPCGRLEAMGTELLAIYTVANHPTATTTQLTLGFLS